MQHSRSVMSVMQTFKTQTSYLHFQNKAESTRRPWVLQHIRNYFLVYQLISDFLSYLQNYKEFKAKILDLQPEKYGLSFGIKKCTTSR